MGLFLLLYILLDKSSPGIGYRIPPKEIRDIVDAPPLPVLSFSPYRDKILFLKRTSLPPLSDLARPEEKLAGVRIDGSYNARSRMYVFSWEFCIFLHACMSVVIGVVVIGVGIFDSFLLCVHKLSLLFLHRSFYTGIGIHSLLDDGTLGPEKEVHGFPDGAKINFVSW